MPTILERIARGDTDAAEACVQEYSGLVWRLAKRYLDRAESEIEDAVQEVFIEIWLHAKRFDSTKGSEAAFIATLAHRRLIDKQRRITSRRRTEIKARPTLKERAISIPIVESADAGIPQAALYREELARGFQSLPEDEQTALWMSVYSGLSHREISHATEAPIGTVKSRIRRAMIRMTKTLLSSSSEIEARGGDR